MLITPVLAQEVHNAAAAPLLIAVFVAVFWRTVLRVLLAALLAITLVLLGFGAIMLVQVTHA